MSTRVASAGWWVFSLVILVAYAVTLDNDVRFLSNNDSPDSVAATSAAERYQSVDHMLDNPAFRMAVLDGGASHYMLMVIGGGSFIYVYFGLHFDVAAVILLINRHYQ